ncbi:MAG: hypothetical protein U9N40_05445 [Euryarchaeota archaeon]|nr:hypothetical protein [Euryarchaeota archaeon]
MRDNIRGTESVAVSVPKGGKLGRGIVFISVLTAIISAIITCGCLSSFYDFSPSVKYPSLTPGPLPCIYESADFTFPVFGGLQTVDVLVNSSVYRGAKETDKSAVLYDNLTREEWLPGYYEAFIFDSHHSELYEEILSDLQDIKKEESLDSDEYLELITVFVQSIEYNTNDRLAEPKYPVETVSEKSGDCDDKSILLAALLSHEGYNTSLFYFDNEGHMAVGVLAQGCSFKNTGYAYIETTNVTFVGVVPEELTGGIKLESNPLVIPIGSGTKIYNSCEEVQYIERVRAHAQSEAEVLALRIEALADEENLLTSDINELKSRMDILMSHNNLREYNRFVPVYNSKISEYNRLLVEYNRLVDLYDENVRINNYILRHPYDRKGTYFRIKNQFPVAS